MVHSNFSFIQTHASHLKSEPFLVHVESPFSLFDLGNNSLVTKIIDKVTVFLHILTSRLDYKTRV